MTFSFTFIVFGLAIIAIVAAREHKKIIASRLGLLDACRSRLCDANIAYGGDGFPILEGRHGGRFLRAELIPDSMTIRRLPQLWLKLTLLESRPRLAEFSLLARPSGTEFYSLTSAHAVVLDPPSGVPGEVIAKGSRHAAQHTLDLTAPALRRVFSDQRMKEVAVTAKGLRLVWQAAEGTRGEHLLFRQCRFDNAGIDPSAFAELLDRLNELGSLLDEAREAEAA
jgi:hypothetical protein